MVWQHAPVVMTVWVNGQLNHQRECVCSDWMSECQGMNVAVLLWFGVCFGLCWDWFCGLTWVKWENIYLYEKSFEMCIWHTHTHTHTHTCDNTTAHQMKTDKSLRFLFLFLHPVNHFGYIRMEKVLNIGKQFSFTAYSDFHPSSTYRHTITHISKW